MEEEELMRLKDLITPGVLKIPGVTGVGVGVGKLNVYLELDDNRIRDEVQKTVQTMAQNTPIQFVITGPFRLQSDG